VKESEQKLQELFINLDGILDNVVEKNQDLTTLKKIINDKKEEQRRQEEEIKHLNQLRN